MTFALVWPWAARLPRQRQRELGLERADELGGPAVLRPERD